MPLQAWIFGFLDLILTFSASRDDGSMDGAGQQVPLQAGLSDASVHLIENRREELAQMQWKAPNWNIPASLKACSDFD